MNSPMQNLVCSVLHERRPVERSRILRGWRRHLRPQRHRHLYNVVDAAAHAARRQSRPLSTGQMPQPSGPGCAHWTQLTVGHQSHWLLTGIASQCHTESCSLSRHSCRRAYKNDPPVQWCNQYFNLGVLLLPSIPDTPFLFLPFVASHIGVNLGNVLGIVGNSWVPNRMGFSSRHVRTGVSFTGNLWIFRWKSCTLAYLER